MPVSGWLVQLKPHPLGRMRREVSNSALATAVCAALALAVPSTYAAAQDETFSESTVRENVQAYLRVLVAPKPPSLADFYRFHGRHSEREFEFELRECHERWNEGLTTADGRSELEPKCKQFVLDRAARSGEVPSLYLGALRSTLSLPGASFQLGSLRRTNPTEANAAFLVEAAVGPHSLEISHAANPTYADLGLLGVVRVDGAAPSKALAGAQP
jgi:hypothetical protein